MQILIVDDDEIALMILRDMLTKAGYDVESASDGRQALEFLRKGTCRLVISDWEMPEMNGLELCHAIRHDLLRGYVYVILLTSRTALEERVEGLRAGADDFIAKPYHNAEMLARVGTAERVLSLETRDVAIFAMARLAESRDPETGAHLERVRGYSRLLAQYLGGLDKYHDVITPEYARLIYQTSPLHDIGKVGIPDSVLLKPGRLTEHEFEIMKTHTTIGAKTLGAALREFPGVSFLEMGCDIAATHHERWDGEGYPHGLKGEQIPLCGRIVAVADVYDALTTKRIYKPAFTHDTAVSMIRDDSGKHFDPDVVDAFLQNVAKFFAIHEHFEDTIAHAA